MVSNNFTERSVVRRLLRGNESIRHLQDELRIIVDQLEFMSDEARDKEIRAMVAETPDAALEHHQAQRHLEVIQRHHDHLIESIADHKVRQDQLLDKLSN